MSRWGTAARMLTNTEQEKPRSLFVDHVTVLHVTFGMRECWTVMWCVEFSKCGLNLYLYYFMCINHSHIKIALVLNQLNILNSIKLHAFHFCLETCRTQLCFSALCRRSAYSYFTFCLRFQTNGHYSWPFCVFHLK